MTEQLELPLWETLQSARIVPDRVDFEKLLAEVDEAISHVPESEQLQMAGEAFLRLAEVYAARSEIWIEEWEQASRDPIVERSFFHNLVRQTMAVDLSELMEPAPPRKQRSRRETRQDGSIVVEVEKEAVLAMVDQKEAEAEKEAVLAMVDQKEAEAAKKEVLAHPEGSALLCAHDENVSAWIDAINGWLQTAASDQVQFAQLCQGLGMPTIEIWLGLLLGGFELELQGEFYGSLLWVRSL